jgi:hypothetical protein
MGTLRRISAIRTVWHGDVHGGECDGHGGHLSWLGAAGVAVVCASSFGAGYEHATCAFQHVDCLTRTAGRARVCLAPHMVVHVVVV